MAALETAKFNRILTRFKDGITVVEGANKVKVMETLGYKKVVEKAEKAE